MSHKHENNICPECKGKTNCGCPDIDETGNLCLDCEKLKKGDEKGEVAEDIEMAYAADNPSACVAQPLPVSQPEQCFPPLITPQFVGSSEEQMASLSRWMGFLTVLNDLGNINEQNRKVILVAIRGEIDKVCPIDDVGVTPVATAVEMPRLQREALAKLRRAAGIY